MEPTAGNPSGFFEHQAIFGLHEDFLREIASGWDDLRTLAVSDLAPSRVESFRSRLSAVLEEEFSNRSLWGVKDPRLCRLVSLWQPVLSSLDCQVVYVLVVRHPSEVAASLQARDGFSEEKSLLLWIDHLLRAETGTRGAARYVVDFGRFVSEPEKVVASVLGPLLPDLNEAALTRGAGAVDPELRHHRATTSSHRSELSTLAGKLWSLFEAANRGDVDDWVTLDALARDFEEVRPSFDGLVFEHFLQLAAMHREELDERTEWLREQAAELAGLRLAASSLQEQLDERTKWLRIQADEISRLEQRLTALERRGGEET